MCHLFIQSTALFALSNITYYVFYVDKGEEQIDICLMLCFLLRISKQCSVCSELTNRPLTSFIQKWETNFFLSDILGSSAC